MVLAEAFLLWEEGAAEGEVLGVGERGWVGGRGCGWCGAVGGVLRGVGGGRFRRYRGLLG